MAPAAAPTPVPMRAPLPAPYPVPAPTAAPAPAPTAAPPSVPHAVVASVTSDRPITADAILFFTDFVVMVHLLTVLLATCVPGSWRTTPRVDSGNWEPGRWRFTPAEKKVHSRRRKNYPRTEKEPMGQLEGKVALITGASKGIGRVMSRLFAEEGAAVVCGARSRDLVEETAALIKGAGGRAVALTGDAATEGDVQKMVAAAVTAFGKLDVLVNNAGDGGPTKRVQEYTTDDWFYTINSCLTS